MRILCTLFVAVSLVFSAVAEAALYSRAYGDPANAPVLFLHGGPGYNSYAFEASSAAALAAREYYVVVFDQLGSGLYSVRISGKEVNFGLTS